MCPYNCCTQNTHDALNSQIDDERDEVEDEENVKIVADTYGTEELGVEVADKCHGDAVTPHEDACHEDFCILVIGEVVERASGQETLCEAT